MITCYIKICNEYLSKWLHIAEKLSEFRIRMNMVVQGEDCDRGRDEGS